MPTVEQLRAASGVQPVKPGVLPKWFAKALKRRFGVAAPFVAHRQVDVLRHGLLRAIGDQDPLWLQNWGASVLPNGRSVFVIEPFGITAADMQQINHLAAELECIAERWADAWYAPGRCDRVVFFQKVEGLFPKPSPHFAKLRRLASDPKLNQRHRNKH